METLSNTQTVRLKEFFKQGANMKQEVADLNDALKDLTKAISEELNVDPKDLKTALAVYIKGADEAEAKRESMNTVEELLAVAGII